MCLCVHAVLFVGKDTIHTDMGRSPDFESKIAAGPLGYAAGPSQREDQRVRDQYLQNIQELQATAWYQSRYGRVHSEEYENWVRTQYIEKENPFCVGPLRLRNEFTPTRDAEPTHEVGTSARARRARRRAQDRNEREARVADTDGAHVSAQTTVFR